MVEFESLVTLVSGRSGSVEAILVSAMTAASARILFSLFVAGLEIHR